MIALRKEGYVARVFRQTSTISFNQIGLYLGCLHESLFHLFHFFFGDFGGVNGT
jgi:hypothetical protein